MPVSGLAVWTPLHARPNVPYRGAVWGERHLLATSKHADYAEGKSRSLSIIGEDLLITGDVRSEGEIQLDGQLHGDVHCASLIVSESSQLEGGVVAEDVVIYGRLKGAVRALRVTLQSTSQVEGDLVHQSLVIEPGALFEGKSRRAHAPLSSSPATSQSGMAVKPRPVGQRGGNTETSP
jgi:cytoskeletal protein CcmA (bactofilin family)